MERKLIRSNSLAEALDQRDQYGKDAMPIAGGQSLLVLLRNKLVDPKVLIDLEPLGELRGLQGRGDGVSIGAMTTIHDLSWMPEVRAAAPILCQAASKVGSTAIRNMGTLGGNLCHNEPGADLPPALLALNAAAELRNRKGTRKVPLRELFRDYFETVVAQDEILCGVEIPSLPAGAASTYLKHSISAEDLAIAGVAVVLIPDERQSRMAREIRIGLGGVAPVPFRASKAEGAATGVPLNDTTIREAGEIASLEAQPVTDPHGSAEYRRKMVKVLVRRAILTALEQSERKANGKA
ncbi:MAG: FAD binding domain-containing protein [Candidatus Binatia bacterium]